MQSSCNYPLLFQPLFRRYLWGGRRLQTLLGKQLGEGDDYAESWEVVDHGEDQSMVLSGPLAGKSLQELVTQCGDALFGQHHGREQFPLLFKFLDCNRTLSVQVHPNDEQAARQSPPDLGKTEAWVVLAAEPGSKIYAGLKPGVTRDDLAKAIEGGTCEECLHVFQPNVGDCVFIEAGTVHALGAGLVIAEIQQASDTTFRLFDWNRVDAQGNPRPLHIAESLEVTNYQRGPVDVEQPQQIDPRRERLVECDKFVLDRCRVKDPLALGGDSRFHLLAVLEGSVKIDGEELSLGNVCLLPAEMGEATAIADESATMLDIYLPDEA